MAALRKRAPAAKKTTCKMSCCAVSVERKAEIRELADASRGRSMFPDDPEEPLPMFGAQCRCGVPRKPPGIMRHVDDDGRCVVHPDVPPQPWTRGAESHAQADGDASPAG